MIMKINETIEQNVKEEHDRGWGDKLTFDKFVGLSELSDKLVMSMPEGKAFQAVEMICAKALRQSCAWPVSKQQRGDCYWGREGEAKSGGS